MQHKRAEAKANAHHKNISEAIKRGKNKHTKQTGDVAPKSKHNTDAALLISEMPPVVFKWTTKDDNTTEECCAPRCSSECEILSFMESYSLYTVARKFKAGQTVLKRSLPGVTMHVRDVVSSAQPSY